jgi:small-conductance mechanosensitive channel
MISSVEASIPSFGNMLTIGNTANFSTALLKLTFNSTTNLISKASIVNLLPNFTLGLICVLLASSLLVIKFSKRIFPHIHIPNIVGYIIGLVLLFFWEMFFFTNQYTQLIPRSWMLLSRNILDFINYMLIAAILSEFVQVLFQKRKNYNGISSTIMKVIRFLIYIVALAFFYTNVLEKDILPILATSSVILTVIGLAVRDVIFDFVAGIAISFDQTFKINHWVNFQSKDRRIDGMIEDLGWRNVIIRSKDDLKHVIPNSQIYAQIISNASITDGNRRVDATFFTNTHVSIDLIYQTVMECALETLKTIPGVPLEKPVRIIFEKIHADGLQLKLQFFLRDKESGEQARSILLNAIHTRLALIHALPARMVQSQSSDMKHEQLMQTGAIDLELGKNS